MAELPIHTAKLGKGTCKAGGPALLFENVTGFPGAKVLMNQFGSLRRMHLALETDSLDAIANRIRALVSPYLEMAEIADRTAKLGKGTCKAGGPALLFENVTGFPGAKVLMNQFRSLPPTPP